MGVQRSLPHAVVEKMLPDEKVLSIAPTSSGVMDTTYIITGSRNSYICKYFERDIEKKICFDKELLQRLHKEGLCVPLHLREHKKWHLYTRLSGTMPKSRRLFFMQQLGRFLAKMHSLTQSIHNTQPFLSHYPLAKLLREQKKEAFWYYKKLQNLERFTMQNDGFIHGDIFCDNTLFEHQKLGVIDFIDGGVGSFAFDLGVVNLSYNPHARALYTKVLLQSYNQNAPKKIDCTELHASTKNAASLYGLLRLNTHKTREKAKELVKFC